MDITHLPPATATVPAAAAAHAPSAMRPHPHLVRRTVSGDGPNAALQLVSPPAHGGQPHEQLLALRLGPLQRRRDQGLELGEDAVNLTLS